MRFCQSFLAYKSSKDIFTPLRCVCKIIAAICEFKSLAAINHMQSKLCNYIDLYATNCSADYSQKLVTTWTMDMHHNIDIRMAPIDCMIDTLVA